MAGRRVQDVDRAQTHHPPTRLGEEQLLQTGNHGWGGGVGGQDTTSLWGLPCCLVPRRQLALQSLWQWAAALARSW